MSGWWLKVSGSVWKVSEVQTLTVSGRWLGWVDVILIEISWINILVFRYYSFSQWPHAGQICGCLSGVWMVSDHVWQINWKQLNKYHGIQILLFLPVAACRPNTGVSEGCLDGDWGCLAVSGWCLSVSGRCLGWVDAIKIDISWINIMVFRYYSFSQWPHAGQIWGCLDGVWGCLRVSGGVWMVSKGVWQMPGGY